MTQRQLEAILRIKRSRKEGMTAVYGPQIMRDDFELDMEDLDHLADWAISVFDLTAAPGTSMPDVGPLDPLPDPGYSVHDYLDAARVYNLGLDYGPHTPALTGFYASFYPLESGPKNDGWIGSGHGFTELEAIREALALWRGDLKETRAKCSQFERK